MKYTRISFTKTSGWFNQLPLAPLDETFRFPLALEEIIKELKKETGFNLKKETFLIHKGFLYHRPYSNFLFQFLLQPISVIRFIVRFFKETEVGIKKWEKLISEQRKEHSGFEKKDLSKMTDKELLAWTDKSIRADGRWIFKIGFGVHVIYHYPAEVFLRVLYQLLVKDKYPQNYHELLIGYPSQWKEADLAFWQVVSGKLSQDEYLKKYGLRANDATLAIPTIGEDLATFQKRVNSFKGVRLPDFKEKEVKLVEKRKTREEFVNNHFRTWIPFGKKLFDKTLKLARTYSPLRESRRFYYTKGTYFIRQALLELGERIKFFDSPNDIFFLTKAELESVVHLNKPMPMTTIKNRKKLWEEKSKVEPLVEINL